MTTSRRTIAVVGVVALLAVAATALVVAVVVSSIGAAAGPPQRGTVIVASAHSKAAVAAAGAANGTSEHAASEFLAAQPTAVWLTPESDPTEVVEDRIAALAEEARRQSARVAVVVYGLPGRDCSGHSAGGLAPAEYTEWTGAIGDALSAAADTGPIVILEPDSLALAPECGDVSERVAQLSDAAAAITGERTWIYVDGGHSAWLPAAQMAGLIAQVDAATTERGGAIRGFATNVSNYRATADEIAYAHEVARHLDGLHAVIDTSRNGAGSDGQWCNPPGRLVGEPGGSLGDDVVDTNLWVKPPGESDGECNGGPAAGRWWPEAAVELTRDAIAE